MGALVWRRNDDLNKPSVTVQSQSPTQSKVVQHTTDNTPDKFGVSNPAKSPNQATFSLSHGQSSPQAPPTRGPRPAYVQARAQAVIVDHSVGVPGNDRTVPFAPTHGVGDTKSAMGPRKDAPQDGHLQPQPKRPRWGFAASAATIGTSPGPSTYVSAAGCRDRPNVPSGDPSMVPELPRASLQAPRMPLPAASGTDRMRVAIALSKVASESAVERGGPCALVIGAGDPPAAPQADPVTQTLKTHAALEELRRKLADKEASVQARKSSQAARQASELAKKASQRVEAEQRRAQLTRGLAALADAAAPEGDQSAATAPSVRLAGPEDVRRVLGSMTDYEVLQLPVGCTASEVRKAYRRLAASLHPDKCRQHGAQEAFIRVTAAYHGLLQRFGG